MREKADEEEEKLKPWVFYTLYLFDKKINKKMYKILYFLDVDDAINDDVMSGKFVVDNTWTLKIQNDFL